MSGSVTLQQAAFATQWGPYAGYAGAALGVDPNVILGQWGLESGYGTNSASAQNNPGAIMAGGALGSYSSPDAFTQAYVNTIQNNFPSAVGAGNNVTSFVNGLANGTQGSYFGSGTTASAYANGIVGAANNLSGTYSATPQGTATASGTPSVPATSNCGVLNGGVFTWACWSSIAADAMFVLLGAGMIFGAFFAGNRETIVNVVGLAGKA